MSPIKQSVTRLLERLANRFSSSFRAFREEKEASIERQRRLTEPTGNLWSDMYHRRGGR